MMGLGQRNRAAPSSWIQLSAVLVNVFKQLNLGTLVKDPITAAMIHSMDRSLHLARRSTRPRGTMVPSTTGTGTMELFTKCHKGSIETGEMLLVLTRLQVQGWQMDLPGNGSPQDGCHQPRWHKEPYKTRNGHRFQEDARDPQFTCQR
jgi:hypothetical protein